MNSTERDDPEPPTAGEPPAEAGEPAPDGETPIGEQPRVASRPDYYGVLQVSPEAAQEDIEAAYTRLAREYEAQAGEDPAAAERMAELDAAFAVLGDPENRAAYDQPPIADIEPVEPIPAAFPAEEGTVEVEEGFPVEEGLEFEEGDEGEPRRRPFVARPQFLFGVAAAVITIVAGFALIALFTGGGSSSNSSGNSGALPSAAPAETPPSVDSAVTTTSSGLKYQEIQGGDGAAPQQGQVVVLNYTGWVQGGSKFDSSSDSGQPLSFVLGTGQIIKGLDEGVASMKVGGKRRLIIPPDLAYGASGSPPVIPANATLIFDLELTGTREAAPATPPALGAATTTTADGLQYQEIQDGTGATPNQGQVVTINFTGWLQADGKKFDSSLDHGQPVSFVLGKNQVLKGWDEGVATMKVGGKRRLTVPPALAFGATGSPPQIPANATLIFDVELVSIAEGGPATPPAVSGTPTKTASGLQYIDIKVGDGATPQTGQALTVNYTGWLQADGSKFDSSLDRGQPFTFTLGSGQVLKGWDEGLATMKVGGKRRLIIPPDLAYGASGVPPQIPANATLIFDVELVSAK